MRSVKNNIKKLKRCYHGGPDYAEFERMGIGLEQVLDFSANSNPFSYRLNFTLDDIVIDHYPDSDSTDLRRGIALQNRVSEENVIVGSGSIELIRIITQTFIKSGDKALLFKPTFGEYETACRIADAQIYEIQALAEDNFRIDVDRTVSKIRDFAPGLVFLCNPNNPTGQYLDKTDVQRIVGALGSDGLLVVDEAYAPFTRNRWDSSGLISGGSSIIIIRSMTKDYALAGLRLGYGLASPEIIDIMMRVKPPWNVNAVAQAAGRQVIEDTQYLASSEKEIRSNREYLIRELSAMGYRVLPSETNFFLVQVGNAREFRLRLMKHGIIVRDCTSFGLPEYIRIAPRTLPECRRLVAAVLSENIVE
ncbi:aminotransferase class I and II [Dehalogenimonas lykanthroporepellens BL-DC-9]|nr:aminotransferase class I and II [Dehalogenimonas lykanthroporepellens BL-DC-9]